MKPHRWSKSIVFYEAIDIYVCSECGSCVLTDQYGEGAADRGCANMRVVIPLDCDEAKKIEGRSLWEDDLPWEDDVKPEWDTVCNWHACDQGGAKCDIMAPIDWSTEYGEDRWCDAMVGSDGRIPPGLYPPPMRGDSVRTFIIHDRKSGSYIDTICIVGGYMWTRYISDAKRFRKRSIAERHSTRANATKGCGYQWCDVDCHVVEIQIHPEVTS